jgi:hypothetical protein
VLTVKVAGVAMLRLARIAAFALVTVSCGAGSEYESDGYYEANQRENERADALADARSELEGLSYQDQHGSYGCTYDCSGHDAGYQWAQDNEIEDAADCGGTSASFIEGCEAYSDDLNELTDDYARDQARDEW